MMLRHVLNGLAKRTQHIATGWPNVRNMLCPTTLQDVALKCCERLARPYASRVCIAVAAVYLCSQKYNSKIERSKNLPKCFSLPVPIPDNAVRLRHRRPSTTMEVSSMPNPFSRRGWTSVRHQRHRLVANIPRPWYHCLATVRPALTYDPLMTTLQMASRQAQPTIGNRVNTCIVVLLFLFM